MYNRSPSSGGFEALRNVSIVASLLFVTSLLTQNIARQTPGVIGNGGNVLLPNGWLLSPAGKTLPLGDLPLNLVLSPDGRYLAIIHSGYGENSVAIHDVQADKIVSRVTMDAAWLGLAFSPNGRTLYVSGAEENLIHVYDFERGYLSNERKIVLAPAKTDLYPGGLA